jgi:hypothetical protein
MTSPTTATKDTTPNIAIINAPIDDASQHNTFLEDQTAAIKQRGAIPWEVRTLFTLIRILESKHS